MRSRFEKVVFCFITVLKRVWLARLHPSAVKNVILGKAFIWVLRPNSRLPLFVTSRIPNSTSFLSTRATLDTPYGKIKVFWHTKDGGTVYEISIPIGCECQVELGKINRIIPSGEYKFTESI